MPDELVRIHRAGDGTLMFGTGPGRGAWVCSTRCFDRALRRSVLARALRTEIAADEAARLRATIDERIEHVKDGGGDQEDQGL